MTLKVEWKTDKQLPQLMRIKGNYKHPSVTGFSLEVYASGKTVWRYKFRDAYSKYQEGKIGEDAGLITADGKLSLEDALTEYRALWTHHKTKKEDIPPEPKGITLEEAFAEWMLKSAKKGGAKKATRTMKDYQVQYERYLAPIAADWPIKTTPPAQWETLFEGIKERSISQARCCFWIVHGIFARAVVMQVLPRNPFSNDIFRGKFSGDDSKAVRETHVPAMDLAAFMRGLDSLATGTSKDAIMCILLTSWRLAGVLQLRWDRIDWEKGIYTVLPDQEGWKGYKGEMALNIYVMGYLEERRKKGEDLSDYVFASHHGKNPYMSDLRTAMKKATTAAGLAYNVTPHDLRRTFATIADIVLHGNGRLIGRLMAHRLPDVEETQKQQQQIGSKQTSKYIQRHLAGERESSRQVAEAILEIGGVLPLDESTVQVFKARGMDIRQPLELVAVEE